MINECLGEEIHFGKLKLKVIEKGLENKRFIEVKFKDETELIDFEDMLMFLFPFCDEKRQEDLIPVRTHRSRILFQNIAVKAQKDIKKGEIINFLNKLSVPEEMVMVSSGKGLIVPKK